MVNTIKFSEMTEGGDLTTTSKTPGLSSTDGNVLFNNPSPNLAPGDTASRPDPITMPTIVNRLRYNTQLESWEYYNSALTAWVQLEDSADIQDLPYWVSSSQPLLPASVNMATLGNCVLKQTVVGGVSTPSQAINGTDIYAPGWNGYLFAPIGIKDSNGITVNTFSTVGPSAVNYIDLQNANTGNGPTISAAGTDANVSLQLNAKGTGSVVLNSQNLTTPVQLNTGTANQHHTLLSFANTAATRTVTFQDADGTVAYLSDIGPGSGAVTVQTFTASDTWTKPLGCKTIIVEAVGGGGGGGDAAITADSGATGGGSGAYCRLLLDVTAISSESVTVGIGGAHNVAGGVSAFGALFSAGGGGAGQEATAPCSGGTAGSASGATLNLNGNEGAPILGGQGAPSYFGGGVFTVTNVPLSVQNGKNGAAPGAGGSGGNYADGATAPVSGSGADGIVIVWEYY